MSSLYLKFERKDITVLMLFLMIAMFCISLYLQLILGLLPCMICELQRYILVPLALINLSRLIFWRSDWLACGAKLLTGLLLLAELALSWRHLTLLYGGPVVKATSTCLPDFITYGLNASWTQALMAAIQGSGEGCYQATWHFMSLNIPEWTAVAMVTLFLLFCIDLFIGKADKKVATKHTNA